MTQLTNKNSNVPSIENTALFICDVQERFRDLIPNMFCFLYFFYIFSSKVNFFFPFFFEPNRQRVIASSRFLLDSCIELGIPVFCTEQYPKVFGTTGTRITILKIIIL